MLSLVCIFMTVMCFDLLHSKYDALASITPFNLNRHCYKSYWYKEHLVSINCSRRCHVGRNPRTKHISGHIFQDHEHTYCGILPLLFLHVIRMELREFGSAWHHDFHCNNVWLTDLSSRHKTFCSVDNIFEDDFC